MANIVCGISPSKYHIISYHSRARARTAAIVLCVIIAARSWRQMSCPVLSRSCSCPTAGKEEGALCEMRRSFHFLLHFPCLSSSICSTTAAAAANQKSTQPGTSIVHIHTERNLKPANGTQTSFFPFFFFFCHTTQSGMNDYLWDKSIGNSPFGVTTNLCDFFCFLILLTQPRLHP